MCGSRGPRAPAATEGEDAVSVYTLTETLHFVSRSDEFMHGETPTSISPGLVNGDYLRREIGATLFDYLVRLHKLVLFP